MKATELKLGDWVYFDNPVREKKEAAKVVAILNDVQLNIVRLEDNAPLLVVISDILPISLTKEILEKNGWIRGNWEWRIGEIAITNLAKDQSQFVVYADNCRNAIRLHKIKYVHQLQHLLWALGIDDDLKI